MLRITLVLSTTMHTVNDIICKTIYAEKTYTNIQNPCYFNEIYNDILQYYKTIFKKKPFCLK